MWLLRRAVQVLLVAATAVIALAALASIGLQTPWMRGWLTDLAERQARRFLAADLQIGRLGGNLVFGLTLDDVVLARGGKPVLTIDRVEVDYDAFGLMRGGLAFPSIRLERPHVRLDRDEPGLGLTSLFKPGDPDSKGPGRALDFGEIVLVDGTVSTEERASVGNFRIPERISRLNGVISVRRVPGRTVFVVDRLSFHGASPEIVLKDASGRFVIAGDDLVFERFRVELAQSAFTLDGTIQNVGGSGGERGPSLRRGL